ncbi:replicative DNA helicase [compost metagenome]
MADKIGTLEDGESAMALVIQISINTPSTANAQAYARVIRERSIDRSLITAAQNIHDCL